MKTTYENIAYENGQRVRVLKLDRSADGKTEMFLHKKDGFTDSHLIQILIKRGPVEYFKALIPKRHAIKARREFERGNGKQFAMKVCTLSR